MMMEGSGAGSVFVTNGSGRANLGGPKTNGSYGSGYATLLETLIVYMRSIRHSEIYRAAMKQC
jgi:hypothetical protein